MSNRRLAPAEEREPQRQRIRNTQTIPTIRSTNLLPGGTRPGETSYYSHDTQPRNDQSQPLPPPPPLPYTPSALGTALPDPPPLPYVPSTSGTALPDPPPSLVQRFQGSGLQWSRQEQRWTGQEQRRSEPGLQGSGQGQRGSGQRQQQYTQPGSAADGPVIGQGVGMKPGHRAMTEAEYNEWKEARLASSRDRWPSSKGRETRRLKNARGGDQP